MAHRIKIDPTISIDQKTLDKIFYDIKKDKMNQGWT